MHSFDTFANYLTTYVSNDVTVKEYSDYTTSLSATFDGTCKILIMGAISTVLVKGDDDVSGWPHVALIMRYRHVIIC